MKTRTIAFGLILLGALAAFELFNFSVTQYALNDLLAGAPLFFGLSWPLILTIALCAMDLSGIAKLFAPDGGSSPADWYLLGAWFLATIMNAALTWWGISLAMLNRGVESAWIPIVAAVVVWAIRLLIVGMVSMAGGPLFKTATA